MALACWLSALPARGDQVEMQNGDHYAGRVLSLNSDTLFLKSDALGTVLRIPRDKIAIIAFGAQPATNRPTALTTPSSVSQLPAFAPTNSPNDISAALRQLGGTNSALYQQVQSQFLSDASPEGKAKFNELFGGLMNGSLSVNDIRVQAKSAADQLRAAKKDLGEDAGGMLDTYLAILDKFVNETEPPRGSTTNALPKTLPSQPEAEK
jgi:hypothetical protein